MSPPHARSIADARKGSPSPYITECRARCRLAFLRVGNQRCPDDDRIATCARESLNLIRVGFEKRKERALGKSDHHVTPMNQEFLGIFDQFHGSIAVRVNG